MVFWLLSFLTLICFICSIVAQLYIFVCGGGLLGRAAGVWLSRMDYLTLNLFGLQK